MADAGERRPAELTIELYRALVDAAPDAIVLVDADGIIRLVNRQAERLFDYDRRELIGSRLERLIPERARVNHRDRHSAYVSHPRTRPMGSGLDLTAVRRGGEEFPVDIALSSILTPDGLLVAAAVRDMTERVRGERERLRLQQELSDARLRQAERLETVGQLAGGIAHDFNNLLAVILNYTEFLKERAADTEMEEDLDAIERAASRAAELTRQLLIFARRDVPRPVLLDVNAVIGGIEKILRHAIGEHIELHVTLGDRVPPVRIDPGQLEQVLLNVAVNARDAMPNGGTLTIATKREGDEVDIALQDTGIGMPPEVKARAFEPFFTTKPVGVGTGLGLATVHGIVTTAAGSVRLSSEPGRGTMVTIRLPAAEDAPQQHATTSGVTGAPRGDGESILLVEDEPDVLQTAKRVLEGHGYRVVARSKTSDAIEYLSSAAERVDLLVTDVVMPGPSGVQLARQARALRPGLPILFMSGYAPEIVAAQGVDEGGSLISKPFTRDELLAAVRRALRHGARG
jgi:PAS domain S-box-containing protein